MKIKLYVYVNKTDDGSCLAKTPHVATHLIGGKLPLYMNRHEISIEVPEYKESE